MTKLKNDLSEMIFEEEELDLRDFFFRGNAKFLISFQAWVNKLVRFLTCFRTVQLNYPVYCPFFSFLGQNGEEILKNAKSLKRNCEFKKS